MQPERRPSPDQSLEALEARLRALPPPVIPADLEARLLAAMPMRPRRWVVRTGLAGALAAASLLAVLAWQGSSGKKPEPGPDHPDSVQPLQSILQESSASAVAWRVARRDLDVEDTPAFTWPLETTPIRETRSIPRDLLE